MLNRFLPQRADNTYRGHKLALWLFGLIVLMKVVISVRSMFDGYRVAINADGIPLNTFPTPATQTVVSLFALLGLATFTLCLVGVVVLVRYRSLIPFMFALLLLQYLAGRLILRLLPVVTTGTPPGFYVNLAILVLMIVGLALSLRSGSRVTSVVSRS